MIAKKVVQFYPQFSDFNKSAEPKDNGRPKFFNFIDKNQTLESVRFKRREKFPKNYLIWQAIDEFGNVSKPYIKILTLKANEYLEECVRKRLLPFINE